MRTFYNTNHPHLLTMSFLSLIFLFLGMTTIHSCFSCWAFTPSSFTFTTRSLLVVSSSHHNRHNVNVNKSTRRSKTLSPLFADVTDSTTSSSQQKSSTTNATPPRPSDGMEITHTEPEDVIIHIAPKAMIRLRELQKQQPDGKEIVLRMGVRNGGCSGLSYVMDFSSREDIQEDDAVDEYPQENIVCVVDAKSMLYLYGLELDYSDALIGGGFKFFNPNAEESCGCGSSFGV